MKIQFEANQDFQLEAIQSVIDIFTGQQLEIDDLSFETNFALPLIKEMGTANNITIDEEQISKNVHTVQIRNKLSKSDVIESGVSIPTKIPFSLRYGRLKEGNNFTLEMETGTGKTYVYLRTILELNKTYGFKKFIIVVPSLAIKEGVLKNLQITKEHFSTLYNNPKMDYYVWDSKKRGIARAFATNNSLQILVLTIDSFTRAQNIIHQQSDWGMPIEYISKTNPIVIVDEPQNMETDIRKKAIQSLNPLCTLRYSATHSKLYNLIYKLDPVKAYDLGLVKKIEVDSVMTQDAYNSAYIKLLKIERKGKSNLIAHIEADKDDERGLQRVILRLNPGDDMFESTGREIYKDYVLDRIDAQNQTIEFANGQVFSVGQKNEGLQEEVIKFQIQRTIENHFEKVLMLKKHGIKVLSLLFIDKVSNYRLYENGNKLKGKFAMWFEEAYNMIQAKPKFSGVLPFSAQEVHDGYFSKDRSGTWKDTRGDTITDDDTYELIMKDKERLLNADVPLRFIFTHSALREGWDNPNIFQICTLNESSSEIKKRQEIGRGLRLPVNNKGVRVQDSSINILTIIANESYDSFAKALQTEIEQETGVSFGERIKSKRDRRQVILKKGFALDENFKEIWNKIKAKTKYKVQFDSDKLISEAVKIVAEITVQKPKISTIRAGLTIDETGVKPLIRDSSGKVANTDYSFVIPDVIGKIQSRTRLTRTTILSILNQSGKLADCTINPQQIIDEASSRITTVMKKTLVDGIKYEKIDNAEWEMQSFENEELIAYFDNLLEVKQENKTLFDHILVDSDIERSFARELETREDIKFYFKLPGWFKIDTPLGGYNPDWAVLFEGDKKIYFVAETKGTNDLYDPTLADSERQKIQCGKKHFELFEDVEYKAPVKTVQDMLN